MDRWSGRVAMVTGASMGIGEATVRALARHGMKVVACARSYDKLEDLKASLHGCAGEVLPVRCDMSDAQQILAMFEQVKEKWGGVDVCINNAGVCLDYTHRDSIIDGDINDWKQMSDVNVIGLCLCTRESVKSMRSRGVDDGQIININSLSGHRVGKAHFYSATKFAVSALTEGIRWELRGIQSHIRVSSISPAFVNTRTFHEKYMSEEEVARHYSNQALSAEDLADQVIHILSAPPHVQIHDILMRPTEAIA